ncbi:MULTISPECIES: hypothetical protein, partial [unclassified Microcoleus]|uniref:hypothetical protein n=1 Tax=unclassified Microcoleus TaxID=2642155 RepID=UPI0025E4FB3D
KTAVKIAGFVEDSAVRNRVYTDKTRLRGLKKRRLKSPDLINSLHSAEAEFVCVDAVSTAVFFLYYNLSQSPVGAIGSISGSNPPT